MGNVCQASKQATQQYAHPTVPTPPPPDFTTHYERGVRVTQVENMRSEATTAHTRMHITAFPVFREMNE